MMLHLKTIVFSALVFIFLSSFAMAFYEVTASGGSSTFGGVPDSQANTYTFYVSHNDSSASANISQVSILLPSGFSYTGSASSSMSEASFSSSGQTLTWSNASALIMNGSTHSFSFAASPGVIGNHTFNVTLTNATQSYVYSLIVYVNDTTAPSLTFVAPGFTSGANLSRTAIAANVSVSDNSSLGAISLFLLNGDSVVNYSLSSGGASSLFANFTGLSQGTYFINATANDSFGNVRSQSLRFVIDTSAPSVSLSKTFGNRTFLNVSISISDSTGTLGACSIVSGGGTIYGTTSTQSLTKTSLSCGNSYSFNVSCTDYASNVGYGVATFSTDSCDSSTSSTSSSATTSGTTESTSANTWSNTFSADSSELSSMGSLNRILGEWERIRVKVAGQTHHVGIITVSGSSAVVNVSSESRQVRIDVGDSELFELTGDNTYDLKVSVLSTNSTSDRANITLESSSERILNQTFTSNVTASNPNASEGDGQRLSSLTLGGSAWVIVVASLAVLAALAGIFYWFRRRNVSSRLSGKKS